MAQIALHDYLEQINHLLEDEQPTEAITHCRHLLKQYPRHVGTYRLLARALLEHREFEDAAELFQRILSADPNDVVAHIGLADVYREEGKVDEAIWHIERAYEMSPYEIALQEVLRELYMRRDGDAPKALPLTRAALARLYFNGELYQQAADELRSILGNNGDDRVDLQVLLAETLWRDNQRVDAVDIALKVLEKLPDSVTVNAILAEIWLLTGRTEEAQGYLQHLRSLTQVDQKHIDPDSVVGRAFQADGAPKLPETIEVERWRATPEGDSLDSGTRVGTEQPIEDERVYDWLKDTGGTGELLPIPELEDEEESDWFTDRLDVPPEQEESFAKTAEWLERMGVEPDIGDDFDFTADTPDAAESAVAEDNFSVDDSLDWMELEADIAAEPIDALPDWLTDLEGGEEATAETDEEESDWFTSALNDDTEEEMPDAAEFLSTGDLLAEAANADFDWLVESEPEDEEVDVTISFADEAIEQEAEDSFDWFAPTADDKSEEKEADFDASLDMIDLFTQDTEESVFEPALDTNDLLAEATEADFDWLMESEQPDEVDVAEPVAAEEDTLSDWFTTDLDDEAAEQMLASEMAQPDDLLMDSAESDFDWLMASEQPDEPQLTDSFEAEASADDQLDWLTSLEQASTTIDDTDEPERVGTGDLFGAEEANWLTDEADDAREESGSLWSSPTADVSTDELFAGALDSMPDWLNEEAKPEEPETSTGELLSTLLDTNELFGDLSEMPDWLEDESLTGGKTGQAESGLIRRMNRMMGTDDLFDDDFPEMDSDFEERDSIPSGFTGLLIGTGDLIADDEDEEVLSEEPLDQDETPARSFTGGIAGLMGTDELLADLGTDIPDWLRGGSSSEDEMERPLQTADLHAENLDDVPHWLFREEDDEQPEEAESEGPRFPQSGIIGTAELFASLGEEVPDWISEFSKNEDEDESLASATGLSGTADLLSELDEEIPDWMGGKPGSRGKTTDEAGDGGFELEDEALGDEESAADAESPHVSKSLLDWLSSQAAAEGSPFEESSEDEWETMIMADNEHEFNMDEMPEDSDDLDWLGELAAQDDSPDEGKKKPVKDEKDLSDWLSELTEPATESEAALADADDELSLNLTDTDLPDWMKELGEASTSSPQSTIAGSLDNLPDWLKPPPDAELGLGKGVKEPELEDTLSDVMDVDDDALDWLGDLAEIEEESLPDLAMQDSSGREDSSDVWLNALATEDGLDDEGDLAFLDNALESMPTELGDEEVDLPDWLAITDEGDGGLLEMSSATQDDDLADLFNASMEEADIEVADMADDLDAAEAAEALDWLNSLSDEADDDLADIFGDEGMEEPSHGAVQTAEFLAMFGDDDEIELETAETADDLQGMPIDTDDFLSMFDDDSELETADEGFDMEAPVQTAEFLAMFGDDEELEPASADTADEMMDMSIDTADFMKMFEDDDAESETADAELVNMPDWLMTSALEEKRPESETADSDDDVLDLFGDAESDLFDFDELEESDSEALFEWLDAAQEEPKEPVAELGDFGLDDASDDVSDWLTELVATTDEDALESEGAALPDWLSGTAGAETDELSEALSDDFEVGDLEATFVFSDQDDVSDEDLPDWLRSSAGSDSEMETADDLMAEAWDEEEAGDLLPALQMTEDELALDDPMAWLDQLAADQDESVEELPSILDTSMYDTLTEGERPNLAMTDEMPEDDEAAMAWLEALAEEQEVDLEEEMPLPVDVATSPDPDLVNLLALDEAETPGIGAEDLSDSDDELVIADTDMAALSWLDDLEDEDEFAGLPTLLEDMSGDSDMVDDEEDIILTGMLVADDEPALGWLDALDESDGSLVDEMETAVADTDDSLETVVVPDDLEEAMAWLDNLEAEEDEDMLEPLPTLDDMVVIDEVTEVQIDMLEADEAEAIDWLTAMSEMEEADIDEVLAEDEEEGEALDWLSAMAEEQEEEVVEVAPEPLDPLQETLDRLQLMALEDAAAVTVDMAEAEETAETESLNDVLDWLEAQLTGTTVADEVEEPELTIAETEDVLEAVDEDTPDWLAAMEPLTEDEEEEEAAVIVLVEESLDFTAEEDDVWDMPAEMSDEMSDEDILAFMDSILDSEDSFVPEKDVSFTPDDPDAVPSFYAAPIAAEEEEPAPEILETADDAPFEESLDFTTEADEAEELGNLLDNFSDDMSDDDILAFMESVLLDENAFVPEKDVSFTPDDPNAVPSFYTSSVVEEEPIEEVADEPLLAFVDIAADEDDLALLDNMLPELSDDMSDDDILSFMDSILGNENSFIPEKDVSFTPDDPNAVPSFAVSGFGGQTDKPESTEIDELPDDPDDAIAWLKDLADSQDDDEENMPITSLEDLNRILPDVDEAFTADLFVDVVETTGTSAGEDTLDFDETLADSLPDWLDIDGSERMPGHTDWLRSLPEPDIAGWLEAEEEVMSANIFDEIPVPAEPERPSTYVSSLSSSTLPEVDEPEAYEEEVEEEEEISTAMLSMSEGVLDKARQAMAQGNYDVAMKQYRNMIEGGQGLSALIADLESATDEYSKQPRLRRILGDAYMRNGQLQRALETYRVALDEL